MLDNEDVSQDICVLSITSLHFPVSFGGILEMKHFDLFDFIHPRGYFSPVWIVLTQQEATE